MYVFGVLGWVLKAQVPESPIVRQASISYDYPVLGQCSYPYHLKSGALNSPSIVENRQYNFTRIP